MVRNPKQTLVDRDWYKLQRCLGNRDGFDRQGEIFLGVSFCWGLGGMDLLTEVVVRCSVVLFDSFYLFWALFRKFAIPRR